MKNPFASIKNRLFGVEMQQAVDTINGKLICHSLLSGVVKVPGPHTIYKVWNTKKPNKTSYEIHVAGQTLTLNWEAYHYRRAIVFD